MEKDSTGRPLPVEANDFENNCPIWHFFGQSTRIRPAFALRLTCDGTGKIPKDYNVMFGLLRELLHSLRSDEFEHVTVQLGLGYHADERLALRDEFEELMGKATVMDGNEGRHMEFCPRDFKEEWNAAN